MPEFRRAVVRKVSRRRTYYELQADAIDLQQLVLAHREDDLSDDHPDHSDVARKQLDIFQSLADNWSGLAP